MNRTASSAAALLVLALFCLLTVGAAPVQRQEARAWRALVAAVEKEDHSEVVDRATSLLDEFPDSEHAAAARLHAARSLIQLERWRPARRYLQSYLATGDRKGFEEAKYLVGLSLAREGRSDEAAVALTNHLKSTDQRRWARAAARELAEVHAFAGDTPRALEAYGVLLDRNFFDEHEDLPAARKVGEPLSDEALDALESDRRGTRTGGLLAFLAMERHGALLESAETEPARRNFAHLYPDHPLLSLVPGAEAWAAEPDGGNPRVVGVLLPQSGRFAPPGELARRGIDLAVQRAAEMGLEDLRLVPIDTRGDPEVAAAGLRELAGKHDAVAVLGPMIRAEGERVADVAEELGLPLLMLVQQPGLAEDRPHVFNAWSHPEEQAVAAVDHAMGRLGLTRFAIAYPATEPAARAARAFWDAVRERGGEVSSVESFPADATDFRETARRLKGSHYVGRPPGEADLQLPLLEGRSKPQLMEPIERLVPGEHFQAVFVPTNYKQATMVAPGFLYEEINLGGHLDTGTYLPVTLLGGAALNHPEFVERGGKYVEGAVLVDGFFLESEAPAVREFVSAYTARYGGAPTQLEAAAYDATSYLLQLLAEGVPGRRELRKRLSLATPARTVTGARRFGEDGEMEHELLTLSVRKGAIVQVWPPAVEEAAEGAEGASSASGRSESDAP